MRAKLLIVDDEPDLLQLLKRSLEPDLNCRVDTTSSARTALEMLSSGVYDLLLADIKMPVMSGLELLEVVKTQHPDLTVVLMTAYGHVEMAVEAMQRGAYDFITKPFEHEALIVRLEKALERSELIRENSRLQQVCGKEAVFENLVGKSPRMQRLYESIRMVAATDLTVLITGPSGAGKDLTARAVHSLSDRKDRPFIAVNCPSIPENILESELFGYKKGAFTHATQDRTGLFQEANTGTIFLDEIGDVSPTIQTKLLRVLQEKEVKLLGDARPVNVDVRIIASTNQILKEKIQKGEFREDFFYRLNVLPLELPALREHREDIPLIADHLLEKHCAKMDRTKKRFSNELVGYFMNMPWEGNVREMENLIMRGILFSTSEEILPQDVGIMDQGRTQPVARNGVDGLPYRQAKENTLEQFNHTFIGELLALHHGNVTQAARQCGLERQSLQQIMKRYGIKADKYRQRSEA
ncbi:MAG: sigma-54-dependent Fis family transcriptional regulator [Deltaproteobacteria bacterium]|nr:MAG: sigma-54-dependent Fis family transcriptional regulator [Deltaproteobacteria bacterium]